MNDLKAERDALRDAVVNWSIEAAELKREVERLTANRDFWHESCLKAWDQRDMASVLRKCAEDEKAAERARVTELETAAGELRTLVRDAHRQGYESGSADEHSGFWDEGVAWDTSDARAAIAAEGKDEA